MTIPPDVFNQVVDADINHNMARVRALVLDKSAPEICRLVIGSISLPELLSALDDFKLMNKIETPHHDYSDIINNICKAISILKPGV
ncbi:hypothetical protein [Xenorhabdus koppenhoeferi]|uniref:Uncharacterized protein n=1 Tax=Xenorhabdus koppenhoeferi TaxID=351659 RepID=A0A1I7H5N1_9GAMM|nr:hypothetical protein [Xenorhabdus koppenhoeferi]CEE94261.1 hypothetical protein XNA1_4550016 [Xenorhabdus nematophila str. Anatoliense]SFU55969.1 hypothetical protein SAMN05421784_11177 [Xenorhabdus koppenhoeferi]